jgi:hypothetical protein
VCPTRLALLALLAAVQRARAWLARLDPLLAGPAPRAPLVPR